MSKIRSYERYCACDQYRLRATEAEDVSSYSLNIEFSLACQGKCAMCCVYAPDWHGTYDLYEPIASLIERLNPKAIHSQGGEVLIQEKTMAFLEEIKRKRPEIRMSLGTNGNAEVEMVDRVAVLFSDLHITFVGFQPESYKRVMGMDVGKTMRFVEGLSKRSSTDLTMIYLLTPITIHEVNLFIEWVIHQRPASINIRDAASRAYMKWGAMFDYWPKVVRRTSEEVCEVLAQNHDQLEKCGTKVCFDAGSRDLFAIDSAWVEKSVLGDLLVSHVPLFDDNSL